MNIMMIGMLSLISNPLVHSTCTASLLLFALFLPRLIYRNLFPARRRRRWSSRKPEKWRVHPGKGGGLSFSPSLRKERMEGTTEVEMGPKLVPPPFPSRSVGRVGVQACKPSLGKEVAVSVVSSFLQCSSVP